MSRTEPDTPDPYVPISCDTYSLLEAAIVRRRRLHLAWNDGNVVYDQIVTPLDLQTRAGAEYLICRSPDDALLHLRLDRLKRADLA